MTLHFGTQFIIKNNLPLAKCLVENLNQAGIRAEQTRKGKDATTVIVLTDTASQQHLTRLAEWRTIFTSWAQSTPQPPTGQQVHVAKSTLDAMHLALLNNEPADVVTFDFTKKRPSK